MSKTSPRKGKRIEREVVNMLRQAGIEAQRVPLSRREMYKHKMRTNAAGGLFAGDIVIAGKYTAEVKARKNGVGFVTIERWMKGSDALILKRDRKPPIVVLEFDTYTDFLNNQPVKAQ